MNDPATITTVHVSWLGAVRIIRSIFPPVDLFEDIADPNDWPLLLSAEQKTNPRLMETIGNLDLVPEDRRVGGQGESYLMAPFTQVSTDRKSRFGDGTYGILYAGQEFETVLFETIFHHERFMASTNEPEGWSSQFREITLDIEGTLADLRHQADTWSDVLNPNDYSSAHALSAQLRHKGSNGIIYPSVRKPGGKCIGLFYPDLASDAVQGRHLDYHWDGQRVNYVRDPGSGEVFKID